MKTRLFIKVNNQWKEIDMFNDVEIPLTLNLTDIRQFGSKTSEYSLDFDIPHTSNNAEIFGLQAEIDAYNGTFEIGKDYEAYLTDDCFTIFNGQFRLKKIIKKQAGRYIYYTGYLFGNVKTFVDKLGNKTLIGNDNASDDLDFSEYNTPKSEMTLSDFVDRLQTNFTDGEDWALTIIDKTNKYHQAFSSGSQMWYTDECTPYLGAMGIFNRIISGAGYRYTSKFLMGTDGNTYLQDDRWKDTIGKFDVYSMIYPYMKHNSNIKSMPATSSVITQNDVNTSAIIAQTQGYSQSGLDEIILLKRDVALNSTDFTLVENNTSSTITAYDFTATVNGYYNINWNFNLEARIMLRNVLNDAPAGFQTINTQGNKPYTVWVELEKNGTLIGGRMYSAGNISGNYTSYQEYTPEFSRNEYYVTIDTGTLNYSNSSLWMNEGDKLKLYMYIQCPVRYDVYNQNTEQFETHWVWHRYSNLGVEYYTNFYPKYVQFKLTNNGNPIISNVLNDGFYEGNDFYPNCILNPKTTKLDFFNTFVKMFNLYVEDVSGKKNYETGGIYPENCLRIEPYECFYAPVIAQGDSNVKDWTNKIDWDNVEYRRVEDYLYNIQRFNKVQDNDYFDEQYNSTYSTPYGDRDVIGPYCTNDDINEVSLKFGAHLCGVVNASTDVLQCPKVFTLNKEGVVDTKKEYSDGLFFLWKNDMYNNTSETTNYTLKLQSRLSASYTNITTYFCADTLNKGYGADDANLNWGGTSDYFQNMKGTIPTYNDLYSAFYKSQYLAFTSTDARVMRAQIYLSSFDIATLQLSDSILIDNHYWRILKINQWCNENTPCEIELIKV